MRIWLCFTLFIVFNISCGWQLRGWNTEHSKSELPSELAVISDNLYSPFANELKEAMKIMSITANSKASLQLVIIREALNKRTVAVSPIGSAAQYELRLTVDYHYQIKAKQQGLSISKSANTTRIYDFEPGNNLAKTEEEITLLKEMRRELANKILLASRPL